MARHTADLDALVGRTLGRRRYEVVARIAQGGMAIVYRGHDRQLDRVVAIKVPRPEFARDRGFSEQFRREARTAARLSHPNVVAVYDSGEERGLPWIVMEHVSGRTLREVLDSQRRLSPETTAELLGPVADALDHAHHAGVVHLDVKPENLLLTSETVKVADFGLVRAAAQRGHGQALAATVHYCAPEVLRGGVVDGRADVYALGVVAWECVERPAAVRGRRPPGRPAAPGRPGAAAVAGAPAGIPEPFDVAVTRATDPDPTRRFLRASDFAAAIGAPRRRRVDEALRATTLLAPTGPDTTAGWAAAAGAAGRHGRPSAPTTGLPVEGRGTATQGRGGQAPPREPERVAGGDGAGRPPPAERRPRPTTGRVPKTRARRKDRQGPAAGRAAGRRPAGRRAADPRRRPARRVGAGARGGRPRGRRGDPGPPGPGGSTSRWASRSPPTTSTRAWWPPSRSTAASRPGAATRWCCSRRSGSPCPT